MIATHLNLTQFVGIVTHAFKGNWKHYDNIVVIATNVYWPDVYPSPDEQVFIDEIADYVRSHVPPGYTLKEHGQNGGVPSLIKI